MKKDEIVQIFNQKLKELVNDLIGVYPNDKDLYAFKTSLNMMNMVNDKQCIKLFIGHVHNKYGSNILKREEDFFMNHSYEEEINMGDTMEVTIQLIDKIKGYWKEMSNENKEIIWSYLTIMVKLCDKYLI